MRKLVFIFLLIPSILFARDGAFMWDANTEPDIDGYRVYYNGVVLYDVKHPTTKIPVFDVDYGYYTATVYDIYENESEQTDPILVANYFNAVKYDYDSNGKILYKGEHQQQDALDSDTNWQITKYYYTSGIITGMRIRVTSWTNRAQGW